MSSQSSTWKMTTQKIIRHNLKTNHQSIPSQSNSIKGLNVWAIVLSLNQILSFLSNIQMAIYLENLSSIL